MKKWIYYISLSVLVSCILFFSSLSGNPKQMHTGERNVDTTGFVVMELFTSQGCSSCPPADALLGMYAEQNDEHIIPLAFHVDYWNRLGWVDPFSKSLFSERQREYAQKLNIESIYTPQMIINGQKQMIGSDKEKIAAITNAYLRKKAVVKIIISGIRTEKDEVVVEYSVDKIAAGMNINATLAERKIITQVRGGENRGVKLENYNVVRDFKTKSLTSKSGSFSLQMPHVDDKNSYMVVVFVQDINSSIISGAVRQNIAR